VIDAAGLDRRAGFVDFGSHLGFHLDRTDAGCAARELRLPRVDHRRALDADPAGRPGVPRRRGGRGHAIVLAPRSSGVCSVLKLGAKASSSATSPP
jgi:hypothetical protein